MDSKFTDWNNSNQIPVRIKNGLPVTRQDTLYQARAGPTQPALRNPLGPPVGDSGSNEDIQGGGTQALDTSRSAGNRESPISRGHGKTASALPRDQARRSPSKEPFVLVSKQLNHTQDSASRNKNAGGFPAAPPFQTFRERSSDSRAILLDDSNLAKGSSGGNLKPLKQVHQKNVDLAAVASKVGRRRSREGSSLRSSRQHELVAETSRG
jgi:hypothetical protein